LITDFFRAGPHVPIVEDAAQSFGASYKGIPSGKLGEISCLSFDPTKNLPNYGSGGMILTDDEHIYNLAKGLRNNGLEPGVVVSGTNSKMSEIDCANMLVKLKYFDAWQKRRDEISKFYTDNLREYVQCPIVEPGIVHAWSKYVIRTPKRDALRVFMLNNGIDVKIHYQRALTDQLPFCTTIMPSNFTSARLFAAQTLSLPLYPELLDSEVELVVDSVKRFFESDSK
jgi:dTDP-4-amino-4,6-dideoxygalactose transaminase